MQKVYITVNPHKVMERDTLRLITSRPTREILDFLDLHGKVQYKDLMPVISVHTLNSRLHDFLDLKIVEHHMERLEMRREWYELTDKGRKVVQFLKDIAQTGTPEKDTLYIVSQAYAKEVLEFIDERGKAQYKELLKFVTAHTLNKRLSELSGLDCIEHHFERTPLRKEWYELTERGRKVLSLLRGLNLILEEGGIT